MTRHLAVRLRGSAVLFSLIFGFALLLCPVTAQPPEKSKAEKSPASSGPSPNEFKTFTLQHAKADDAARTLKDLLKVNANAVGTNTVMLYAPPSDIEKSSVVVNMLEALAEKGLKAKAEANEKTWVIPLLHLEPDLQLKDAIKLVFKGGAKGDFSLDPGRKQLILFSDEATFQSVMELLRGMSQPPPNRSPDQNVQVRVVWLASGPAPEGAVVLPPPDDLKEILPGLAKLGINKPRLVAQSIVNAAANSQFQTIGKAELGLDATYPYSVTGQFLDEDMRKLAITILATTRTPGRGDEEICKVQTEITVAPGHHVILGVTPTESMTSVFIIQVIRPEAPKTKK